MPCTNGAICRGMSQRDISEQIKSLVRCGHLAQRVICLPALRPKSAETRAFIVIRIQIHLSLLADGFGVHTKARLNPNRDSDGQFSYTWEEIS